METCLGYDQRFMLKLDAMSGDLHDFLLNCSI